jgi:hypothetical protein
MKKTDTPDPQLRQQLDAKIQKYNEAFDKNDAGAVAAFFAEDAVLVTDKGPIYSREGKDRRSYTTQGLLVRNLCSRGRCLEGSNANLEHHSSTGRAC